MQTNREVMQMALDALITCKEDAEEEGFCFIQDHVIHALREALAQQEPEPFRWYCEATNEFSLYKYLDKDIPLYLAPPEPKVQKGWKLVPIEPSPAMDFAGAKATEDMLSATISKSMGTLGGHIVRNDYDDISSVMGIYKAMITAAPEYKEILK